MLTDQGAAIDTTTSHGKLVFGIFAALAAFERNPIRERTIAGLAAARAPGTQGRTAIQDDSCQAAAGDGGDGATGNKGQRTLR